MSVSCRPPPEPDLIRPSTGADVAAITADLRLDVKNGSGTFEIEAPDRLEIERRRADVLARGWPWLVLEHAGAVAGYAYASPFRPRPAYRFCVEDSVYLAPESVGRGFGRLLLAELLARCEAAGARQMLAVIGDSANAASIGVHRALGFAARRHDPLGGLEVRPLARRRPDAEGARCRRRRRRRRRERRAVARGPGRSRPGSPSSAAASGCIASTCTAGATSWAWLHPWPTLVGAYGFWRLRQFGLDDLPGSRLVLLLGSMIAIGMLAAIVYGVTPAERWRERFGERGAGDRLGDRDRPRSSPSPSARRRRWRRSPTPPSATSSSRAER